jgi:hypothetical protein
MARTDDPPQTRPQITTERASSLTPSPAASPTAEEVDDGLIIEDSVRALLSSNQRGGRWEAADEIEVRAILGDVTLDFTRADLPPGGVIGIEAFAFCGAIQIIVPDGAEVEIEGTPILGSIEHTIRTKGARQAIREMITGEKDDDLSALSPAPETPYFHIDCRAILSSITVTGR